MSEAMVAEAGSGLRAQDIIPMYVSAIAGRVESGDLPFVSFRASWGPGGDGAWALGGGPSHGPGRATPWPEPQRGGFSVDGWTRAGGTSLWAGFAPTAEAGLTLCALHVASINAKPAPSAAAMAFRGEAGAGGATGPPPPGRRGSGGGGPLASDAGGAIDPPSPAVRLPTSNVGLRLRQNPDNAEAVGRRVNLLTEAMKLGVLRPRRYDNPDRDWQQAVRRLAQEQVTQSEATTILNAVRTF